MKKLLIVIIATLFCAVTTAQNKVLLSTTDGLPGDVVTVDVVLQNSDDVTAAEVVIPLVNKQLTYVDGSCVINSERANGHNLSAAVVDGALKIYIYNISLAPLKGNDGQIASFSLELGKLPAEYPLQPRVLLSDVAGKALPVNTSAGAVTILAPQIEVVTQTVDFGHIPIMAQYTKTLTMRNSGTFPLEVTGIEFGASEFSATDTSFTIAVGATKSISVAYLPTKRGTIKESVTIISNAVNGKATAALVADPYSVNELHSNRVEGIAGEEVTVELRMNNMEPIVGLQTTFDLPEQLLYVEESFAATERAATHTAVATAKDGKLTLFLYSSKNTAITGDDGVVATFRLRLAGHSGSYKITPQNTVLSNAGQENMRSAESGEYIVIKSPEISGANELDFRKQPLTEKSTAQYTVRNNGNAPLVINKVAFLNEGYKVADELPITVENYSSAVLNVEYNPIKEGVHSTVMNIYSNDPVNKLKTVQVNGEIYEPNKLTFDGENLQNGNYVVSLGLENYTGIVAMQMDIHWMQGMTTSNDMLKVSGRLAGHSCSLTKIDEDTYRFIAFSFSNKAVEGNAGKLFDLTFVPVGNVNYKDTPILIDNVVLSSSGADNYTSQLTVNAKALFKNYYVRFVCDGEVVSETFQRAGTQIVQPQMPERTGFTFGGWENVPEMSPTKDVEYTGQYIPNKYKVDYVVNGAIFTTDSVAYGNPVIVRDAPTKEGHTFSGWSEAPETMPAEDVIIEGSFTVNSYAVHYVVDGVEFAVDSVSYGNEIVIREHPTKEGHTFKGWSGAPATMPASDVTIEGTFVVNTYDIIYKVDGEEYKVVPVTYGSEILLIDAPVKEGHAFSGWSEAPATMPAGDVTIEGSFTVNSYNVIYKVDGEEYQVVPVTYGSELILIEAPTKEGHTFSGWSEAPATMPAGDVTIEGSFTVNSYNVIYKVDGEEYQVVPVTYGSELILIEAPTKEGHTFSGWSEAPATMPAGDVTIEGSFTVNSYNVIYKVDGEEYQVVPVTYGSKIALVEAPVKEGYTFSGWSETPSTMPAEDVVIEGTFAVNNYTVTYLVDGEVYATETVAYGSEIILREEPVKEGHTFSGWSEAPATMPAESVVIEGSFTVNYYTITYMVDGEVYKTESVAYGSEIVFIDEPTKEGYIFSGWHYVYTTMPAEDVTVEGEFIVGSYTITYMIDGEVYRTENVAYGTAITLIKSPTKEGYTFSGWSEVPEAMPAEDVVIEGSFSVNTYTVTYTIDGEVYVTRTVEYGAKLEHPTPPEKDGMSFKGWASAPDTMPARDIVISGTYSANSFVLTYMIDGEVYVAYTVEYGAELPVPASPVKEGHTFKGWSGAPATMPASDVTVEGTFAVNTYDIIYKVDGEEYKVVPVTYGSEIVLIEEPTKYGHTFSGWSEAPATMPANDIVIEGSFVVSRYTVTYTIDGEVYVTRTVEYGAKLEHPTPPEKDGMSFKGWASAPDTMPARDIVISGTYSANSFVLTYMIDGEVYVAYTVEYGAELPVPASPVKEGHTFTGWSDAPTTMPANDILITGFFRVNNYTITYMVDGKEYRSVTIAYGTAITLIAAPTKYAHTFSGWSEAPATMPAKDIVVEGSFSVNYYTITYIVDGEVYKTETVAYGSSITIIDEPTKEGYTFSGWNWKPSTMPAEDITIKGSFNANEYRITYIVDGKYYQSAIVKYGTVITVIDEPTLYGHTFSGWSDAPATMPAEDVVIEGSFTVNYYTITYMVDGEVYKTESVAYGSEIVFIDEPTKEGYIFSGWYWNNNVYTTMPAEDITVEGEFINNNYTITYTINGEVYKTETVAAGTAITLIDEPTKEGYTFTGWSDAPTTMPANDILITGFFRVNNYTITYMVDGKEYRSVTIAYGTAITLIAAPTKYAHTFSGWSEAPATMPAKDIVVEGSFSVNYYTITYIVDGEVYKTETVAYGSSITIIDEPTKEGYTFSGWNWKPSTMPAEDITIKGSFNANEYRITYIVDGKYYQSAIVKYGTVITVIDEPTLYGHTFSGWSDAPATMPAEDVVIEGSFTVNYYTITYMVDGEVYKTESVAYGSEIVFIDEPTKEGYIFSGWYWNNNVYTTMPAEDITVEGEFINNNYTITYTINGEVYKTETVAAGTAITLIDEPTKEGYTFTGWSDAPTTMPANDILITGFFRVNNYTITYMVDGKEYRSVTVAYGTAITLIAAPTKEGHTFSGWGDAPTTMPAENVTIEGTFAVNNYTITYIVDGEVYAIETVAYGSEITFIEAPTKEGHTFSGWNWKPSTMPAEDITIKGSFNANKYRITYIVNGYVYRTETVACGSVIPQIDEPISDGYTFNGWLDLPETMPAKDIVVEGSFTVNYYTITYIVDGEVYKIDTVAYESAITLIDVPTKEGYTFYGWIVFYETMPPYDITIEGSFILNSYVVTYIIDGEVYDTRIVEYGTKLEHPIPPEKDGMSFNGWVDAPDTMPANDITIEGTFAVNDYTVTYLVDGEVYATETVAYGSEIILRDEPTKEGHTFSGWSEAPATMPAEDVTINGAFTVNGYNVIYKVDGEVYATETVAYGSEIVLRDEPTKEGHTFSGWSEVPATMPAEDVTINGVFTVNTYNVIYKVDGEEYQIVPVTYGSEITLIEAPTKEGHTFSGWSEVPATMPAEDVTINGVFTVNTYNVIYKVDGEEYQIVPVTYGSEITLIEAPTKEGYTFSGWSEAPSTMPSSDVTIEGSFTVNTYNVIYKVDGEEYQVVPVTYGSEITLIEAPTKEGHTFSGWSEAPATMPASDITIEGSFTVNNYTVTYLVDGEVYATETVAYGSEIALRDEPTKEGHTFSGWSEAPATMPAEDVVIEGSFTVNNYTITYMVDGEVYATETVAYGSEIVLIEAPTKEGHTFSGWSEAPVTMPAEDIVIEGYFTPVTFINGVECDLEELIIYNLKGERVVDTDELERGFYIINGRKVWVK